MSETTEKNEPCGACRKKPRHVQDGHVCETSDCLVSYMGPIHCPTNWNYLQGLVLARRKADFEAGAGLHYNASLTLGRQRIAEAWDAYLSRKGDANG